MEKMKFIFNLLLDNWQQAVIGGCIMVCSIVVLMGILKKAILGKIPNKLLRKAVLAFSSIILAFPVTAIYFFAESIDFKYYGWACLLVAVATVIVYWLYENTCLRNLISLIGEKTVVKFASVIIASFTKKSDKEETQKMLSDATEELKNTVNKEISASINNTKDDLSNL